MVEEEEEIIEEAAGHRVRVGTVEDLAVAAVAVVLVEDSLVAAAVLAVAVAADRGRKDLSDLTNLLWDLAFISPIFALL